MSNVPATGVHFGDLLDPRFQEIWDAEYPQHQDMISTFFRDEPTNGRDEMKFSSVGTMVDFEEWTGTVPYNAQFQGYDTRLIPLEYANGFQIERKLYDDDQYHVMDQKPRGLRASAFRTRQKHAARIFNLAFVNDQYFYVNSEGVALCSDSHTTTSNAPTNAGFDNRLTGALTATAVATARRQMVQFRGDQAEIISVTPDTLLYPVDLYEQAYEIISSAGKLDTANNNPNVHQGRYEGIEWNYLTSPTNWFMIDSVLMKQFLVWTDRIELEFGSAEEFDTYVAKWRAYMRYGNAWTNWRWIIGSEVS
jgi:hypothetical protein